MKKGKLLPGAVMAGMLLMAGAAHADSAIKVIIEGQEVKFEKQPVIDSGTTLVPFRALFEALGLDVSWNQAAKTVVGEGEDVAIELQLDRTTAVINGKEVKLSAAPRLIDGSTYVPLRVVGEATGREVKWDQATRTITIGPAQAKEADLEAFYRAYVDASNAKDIEAYLSAFHPESPLLKDGILEREANRVFGNYDVVTETELFEVVEASGTEAVLRVVEKSVNTNERFYLDNRSEYLLALQKDENGEWKIYNLEAVGLQYLVPEERLTADADIDAELEKAIEDVVIANVEASKNEDLQALMATVDPTSPSYARTMELMGAVFLAYDLDYEIERLHSLKRRTRKPMCTR